MEYTPKQYGITIMLNLYVPKSFSRFLDTSYKARTLLLITRQAIAKIQRNSELTRKRKGNLWMYPITYKRKNGTLF
ncbi:MAG: hypothetical protein IJ759_06870 [Bacteroidales bacterium]|nr:hypothetical protein [Bacteroidales bacterium]